MVQGVLKFRDFAIRDPCNFVTTYFQTVILLIHRNFEILMWKRGNQDLEQKNSTFNFHSLI